MTTYPISVSAIRINDMRPSTVGLEPEIMIDLDCSDIIELFDNVTSDGLQQELFKYLAKNFEKEYLKEVLCI